MEISLNKKTQSDETIISSNVFNLIIGALLSYGLVINWIITVFFRGNETLINTFCSNIWISLIIYVALCLYGAYAINKYESKVLKFIGYNLIVVPVGFILSIYLSAFSLSIIINCIQETAVVTILMAIIGTLFPKFFNKWYGTVFTIFVITFFVDISLILFGGTGAEFFITNAIFCLVFCFFIAYDIGKSKDVPKTITNAFNIGCSLYLDIVNLFMTLLDFNK